MALVKGAVQELSALHGEPDWLRARRLEAFDLYERIGLPDTRQDEEWRKVDLKELDLPRFESFPPPNGAAPTAPMEGTSGLLRQRGTSPGKAELDPALAQRGVIFCSLAQAARDHRELLERRLFSTVKPDRDKFAALHGALFSGGTFLYVPDGVGIDRPLISQYSPGGTGGTALPHTLVIAGRGSRFQYMDEFLSPDGDAPILASGSAEIFLEEGAHLGYVTLQNWGKGAWQFANQRIHLGRDSHLETVNVGLGGHFAKLRLEALLEGPGAHAELKGLFFAAGEQSFDFHTLQEHLAPHTSSDLLFKGALRDTARSVYVGLVHIAKQARGTSANQANRNLLLSEHARAASEPILEIENNDIMRCSHGATVGPVDPEHMFYLQSRGIPRLIAQRMVVQGFLGEVLGKIPAGHAREIVDEELARRIG